MNLTLKVWRQNNPNSTGHFETYEAKDVLPDMSFLEMLDVVNEGIIERGADPTQRDGTYSCTYRQFGVRNPIEWQWLGALQRAVTGDPSLSNEHDASWGPPLHAAASKGLDEFVHLRVELMRGEGGSGRGVARAVGRDNVFQREEIGHSPGLVVKEEAAVGVALGVVARAERPELSRLPISSRSGVRGGHHAGEFVQATGVGVAVAFDQALVG